MEVALRNNGNPMTFDLNKASKFLLLAVLCLLARLIPFRVPNIEPITATLMPISSVFGRVAGFLFALLSVLLYDTVTGTLGVHTFFTAGAFGVLGIWAGSYFQQKKGTAADYVRFAIVGTLFFDAVTGLLIGPIFYNQSISLALSGQIPFTALHLLGNVVFAATLSPAIHSLLIKKRKKQTTASLLNALNPKVI